MDNTIVLKTENLINLLRDLIPPLPQILISIFCELNRLKRAILVQMLRNDIQYPNWPGLSRINPSDFYGIKFHSTLYLKGNKVPYRSFRCCKRSLHVTRNQAFRQNQKHFLPKVLISSSVCYRVVKIVEKTGGDI